MLSRNICDVTIPDSFPTQMKRPTAEFRIGVGYSSVAHAHKYDATITAGTAPISCSARTPCRNASFSGFKNAFCATIPPTAKVIIKQQKLAVHIVARFEKLRFIIGNDSRGAQNSINPNKKLTNKRSPRIR